MVFGNVHTVGFIITEEQRQKPLYEIDDSSSDDDDGDGVMTMTMSNVDGADAEGMCTVCAYACTEKHLVILHLGHPTHISYAKGMYCVHILVNAWRSILCGLSRTPPTFRVPSVS